MMRIKKKLSKLVIVAAFMLIQLISTRAEAGGSWNGWIYQDPYPTSVNLFDVKFITPVKGWITGKYGLILYTEDGGETWEAQESGVEEDLVRVFFINEKKGWIIGKQGSVIHTGDGGGTWVKQYTLKGLLTEVFFINEQDGWVTGATPTGVVFSTKDGGKTWGKINAGISRAISSVYFINSEIGWILAGEDVYRTTDGGKKWEKSVLPINVPAAGVRFKGGTARSGSSQTPRRFGISPVEGGLGSEWRFGGLVFADEKQGWAAISKWIFYTSDGGKTWTLQFDTGTMDHGLRHLSFRDTQSGCASGWSIVCTEDGGKTWQERLRAGSDRSLGGMFLVGKSEGWSVGNLGVIMKTADNGGSWKNIRRSNECGDIPFFINKKIGWLYPHYNPRSSTMLCRTDDGGHTWVKQDVGIKIMDIFFINDLSGWAVGIIEEPKGESSLDISRSRIKESGIIRYTADGGKSWVTQHKQFTKGKRYSDLVGVYFLNSNIGWVVGENGVILHTSDGGKKWEPQKSGDSTNSLKRVHFIDSQKGWVTGYQFADDWTGIVLYTEDGGTNWNKQYKLRESALVDLSFDSNKTGWISGHLESDDSSVLLHTENGGKTWVEKGFESVGNNRMAFLGKELGVIYSLETGFMVITTDGGKIWNKRRVPLKKYPWNFSEIFQKFKP